MLFTVEMGRTYQAVLGVVQVGILSMGWVCVRMFVCLARLGQIVISVLLRIIALEGPTPPAVLMGAIPWLEPLPPLIVSALPTQPCFHPCAIVLQDSFVLLTLHHLLVGGVILAV